MNSKLLTALIVMSTIVVSCKNDSGGSSSNSKSQISGNFIDSAVKGLEYKSGSLSGVTDSSGKYLCNSGETVTFYVNDIEVGSANCAKSLTPVSITDSSTFTDTKAQNLAFLLQSMDTTPLDGIDITSSKSSITAIDLSDDAAISSIVSGMPNSGLTRAEAVNHMKAFSGNISEFDIEATCEDSASDPNYSGDCDDFEFLGKFDGTVFTIDIDGYSKTSDSSANAPSTGMTGTSLNLGGVVNGSGRNSTTGATSMTSGDAMYFKDLEESSSSVCSNLGHSYVRHAVRISDLTLNENGSGTGKFSYSVTCSNSGVKTDYDEFWGSLSLTKK